MICVTLHCDTVDCGCEQSYPLRTLDDHREMYETLPQTALRLGSMYGWRFVDELVACPDHSVRAG